MKKLSLAIVAAIMALSFTSTASAQIVGIANVKVGGLAEVPNSIAKGISLNRNL